MFLCNPCHAESKCDKGFIEGLMPSRGNCERCGKAASCLDCHGYNFSGLSDAEIEQKIADLERGTRYSFWLQDEEGGPWRQVDEPAFRSAEMSAGFMRPTGGFSATSMGRHVAGSMTCDNVLEEMDDEAIERLYGYRGADWIAAWRNRDPEKVSTRG